MRKQKQSDDVVLRQALDRGAKLKDDLIERAGGLLSAEDAASVLGIATHELLDRVNKQALIVVEHRDALGYPAFQFESETVSQGVALVLEKIEVDDAWMKLSFMFLELDELGGKTPLSVIRSGNTTSAASAARHFGEQGAS